MRPLANASDGGIHDGRDSGRGLKSRAALNGLMDRADKCSRPVIASASFSSSTTNMDLTEIEQFNAQFEAEAQLRDVNMSLFQYRGLEC